MGYWVEGTNHGGRLGTTSRIYLFGSIGNERFRGTESRHLRRDLAAAGSSRIEVHLHSPGGSAEAALEMYTALRECPNGVVTYADGEVKSGASVVLQAGTLRGMHQQATIEIHKPHVDEKDMPTDPAERRAVRNGLVEIEKLLAAIYASRSNLTVAQWHKLMAASTVFDAENALRAGLVDSIYGGGATLPPYVASHREVVSIGGRW